MYGYCKRDIFLHSRQNREAVIMFSISKSSRSSARLRLLGEGEKGKSPWVGSTRYFGVFRDDKQVATFYVQSLHIASQQNTL